MIGSKLGDYEIVRLIGRGGMGAVYEARNSRINRKVAIKVLLPEYAERADVVRRFHNEAVAVNAINHPGVVQISDVGTAPDGSLYLVMEHLQGETLSERLGRFNGKLPTEAVITISWQLASVLDAAHIKKIVHRDIKLSNVMLVSDLAGPGGERVKLLDFGIAKLGAASATGETVRTRTGQIMGTAAYMAPEQFEPDRVIDGQVDVYSLGVVMYRMLAGRLPFISPGGEIGMAVMHMFSAPPPLEGLAPDASPWLIGLVEQMLLKKPGERPTMADVAACLREFLPFVLPSRSSLGAGPRDPSGLALITGSEPTMAAPAQAPVRYAAPEPPYAVAGIPSRLSQQGSISRATGQLTPSAVNWVRDRRLLLAAGLGILLLTGIGVLGLRNPGGPPPPAAVTASAAAPASTASAPSVPAPPAGSQPAGGSPAAAAAAPAAATPRTTEDRSHSGSAASRRGEKQDRLSRDPNREHGKPGGKRDGKSRSAQKTKAITIIN